MSRVRMGLLSVLGLAAFAAVPASAQAALECGDEIDRDMKLKRNLVCALNQSGLVIDSNGVDFDLNGHKIKGTGTDGVAVSDFDRVTIHGGTIEGFEHGVSAQVADDLTVEDMKIKDSLDQSVRLNQVTDSAIRDNELLENQASNNVVVFGGLSEKVTVARNRMTKGGISFDGGANHRAVGNTITDSLSDAITLGTAGSFLVRGNTIEEAEGFGVIVDGAVEETAIESNRITGTDSSGIFLSLGRRIDDDRRQRGAPDLEQRHLRPEPGHRHQDPGQQGERQRQQRHRCGRFRRADQEQRREQERGVRHPLGLVDRLGQQGEGQRQPGRVLPGLALRIGLTRMRTCVRVRRGIDPPR